MSDPITILTFKWKKPNSGYKLKTSVEYGPEHVNVLYHSLKRNITLPFKFVCVTDDPVGIDPAVEIVPLWDTYRNLGGCYTRLYIFSKEVEKLFGPRFMMIDLDCVIVGNIDSLLKRKEDFLINKFIGKGKEQYKSRQCYNGALMIMNAGARSHVWEDFEPSIHISLIDKLRNENEVIGSDQAWIRIALGREEKTVDMTDGIYDVTFLPEGDLPENAKIVFFHGRPDPSLEKSRWWVEKHWRI